PGRAPGDAQAHALEARLARGLDHAPDDVGAERAVAAAERRALAAPAVTDVGRGLGERDQGGLGHGPGDADVGGIAEVLLGEDGEVVEVDVVLLPVPAHPRREAVLALAYGEAEAAAGAVERRRGAGPPVAAVLAQRGQLAVVDQAADG